MAEIETDTDGIQVADAEDFNQVAGGCGFAEQVFDEQAHAERMGEGAEVFEGRERVLDGAGRPSVFTLTEVDNEVAEGDGLGGFESALDFVHGVDAARFFGVEQVDRGRPGAAHFAVGIERGVHGPGFQGIGAEKGGQFDDMVPAGVVEVVARRKKLDGLGAGTGSQIQLRGVQALVPEQMR